MTRDPWQVLGVSPSDGLAGAEAAYKRLLKEHHPDRHVPDGPDAVRAAEARTRALNRAIAAVRSRGADPWLVPDPHAAVYRTSPEAPEDAWRSPDPDAAAFREDPTPGDQPSEDVADPRYGRRPATVRCPYCIREFPDAALMVVHTTAAHGPQVSSEVGLERSPPGWAPLGPVILTGALALLVVWQWPTIRTWPPWGQIVLVWCLVVPLAFAVPLLRSARARARSRDPS